MSTIRCLDLFCGAGGAGMGLSRAGFTVMGCDIKWQPNYPFPQMTGDALECNLNGWDFVWASPPCQGYCALKTMPNRREHPKLIEEVRDKLNAWGGPWIIENVHGAPLRDAVMLCGSMFGLGSNGFQLRRHRYFESNIPLSAPGPCKHASKTLGVYGAKVRNIAQEKRHYAKDKATRGDPVGVVLPQAWGFEAMGCGWMKITEASEAIPPAYSEHLGKQAMIWILENKTAAVRARNQSGAQEGPNQKITRKDKPHSKCQEIHRVCRSCGSENICVDATARWSPEQGEYSLSSVHDHEDCRDCDGETHTVEVYL